LVDGIREGARGANRLTQELLQKRPETTLHRGKGRGIGNEDETKNG